jgi:hypothetical protein
MVHAFWPQIAPNQFTLAVKGFWGLLDVIAGPELGSLGRPWARKPTSDEAVARGNISKDSILFISDLFQLPVFKIPLVFCL